jgi:hypothetical protein
LPVVKSLVACFFMAILAVRGLLRGQFLDGVQGIQRLNCDFFDGYDFFTTTAIYTAA